MFKRISKLCANLKNNSGFTMMELMVVLAIIGILSSMAIKSYIISRSKTGDATALAEANGFGKAIINVFLDDIDVDLEHHIGDGPEIGTKDTSGNPRPPVFTFSGHMDVEIPNGNTSSTNGPGNGYCQMSVKHQLGHKTFDLIIDEKNQVTSFPEYE